MTIRVVRAGLLTTVQDLGRPSYQAYGVSGGGAADALALRVGNGLLGNRDGEAGLEITATGPELRFDKGRWIVLCGANVEAYMNDLPLPFARPVYVPEGGVLSIGTMSRHLRAYLTIDGGLRLPCVLGGSGTHLRGGFGGFEGRRLQPGDVLPLGEPKLAPPVERKRMAVARITPGAAFSAYTDPTADIARIRVFPGAELREFDEENVRVFFGALYKVSPQSDRMGVRLSGEPVRRTSSAEMLTTGASVGTIQVPPDGQPIVLLADAQPTGGYPRIAHAAAVDLPLLAQLRPGDRLRFELIGLEEAERLLDERERMLARLRAAVRAYWRGRDRFADDRR